MWLNSFLNSRIKSLTIQQLQSGGTDNFAQQQGYNMHTGATNNYPQQQFEQQRYNMPTSGPNTYSHPPYQQQGYNQSFSTSQQFGQQAPFQQQGFGYR